MTLDVQAWIDAYGRAWLEKDADAVAALFTENAVYRSSPFRDPHRGRAGVRDYWLVATADQERFRLCFGAPVVAGRRAAVEWWATMEDQAWAEAEAHPCPQLTLPGCLMLRFDESGRCEELREYWHVNFGEALSPPEGWGA